MSRSTINRMQENKKENPTIITNMAFWQSPEWLRRVDSIYPLDPDRGDPALIPWWREAWKLFRLRSRYDIVLTMGIRESFAYAFMCWLFRCPSRQIMTEVFIDAQRPDDLLWRIKTGLYRCLARRAIGFITNSTTEIETNSKRFGVSPDRFRYVPLNTTISKPEQINNPGGYLFCAGRTLRDNATLAKVINATPDEWQIVTGLRDFNNDSLPEHVTIHREISRDHYLQLLRGARIVILPLLETERSTGQVVLLEAMSFGKPVITTRAPGTIDIIRHGENGYLVEPGDAAGIKKILEDLIKDPEACLRIGHQALSDVQAIHTTPKHTEVRLNVIRELWLESTRTK
ncbi:MAG TPA: glycosyltransferase family 4 protein [Kiritimatiellia bacterium]|nr:glycosyltransferase family 4 protein [Kiritimatiellia bacterium]